MVSGTLFLVVGPSGAGKDTLLEAARDALSDRGDILFPKRQITRPAEAGGEDHVPITPEEFDTRDRAGLYALSWRAHDLAYGVPRDVLAELADGRSVVVNVSRSVLDTARVLVPRVRVLSIRVPSEVLTARLRNRGRETDQQILDRVARVDSFQVKGPDVFEILNDGSVEVAAARFIDRITTELSNN